MFKIWIEIVIIGISCIGIVSGCAIKSINPEKVNKEMMKSEEDLPRDKSSSKKQLVESQIQNSSSGIETPSWLEEENMMVETNIHKNSKSNMDHFDVTQQVRPSKNKSNPFSNLNASDSLKKETDTKFLLADKLEDIFFDLDQYNIDKSAKKILIQNAKWLKQNPLLKVQIEGHCDERGTNNYNIALGTRRALYVKKQLAFLGISIDRLIPISYGEEKAVCFESKEKCWSKNRRVHFLISSN